MRNIGAKWSIGGVSVGDTHEIVENSGDVHETS